MTVSGNSGSFWSDAPQQSQPQRWRQRATMYRTQDPIENLRLRVTLRQTGSQSHPLRSRVLMGQNGSSLDSPASLKQHRRAVRWQEKHFSHRELLRYSKEEAAALQRTSIGSQRTALAMEREQRYRDQVQKLIATKNSPEQRALPTQGQEEQELLIFTYVEEDGYQAGDLDEDEPVQAFTESPSNKKPAPRGRDAHKEMHILASLKQGDGSYREERLCTVQYFPEQQILMLTPGLTKRSAPLNFVLNTHDAYEVEIEQELDERSSKPKLPVHDAAMSMYELHEPSSVKTGLPGTTAQPHLVLDNKAFVVPSGAHSLLYMFGEIVELSQCTADLLYVQYLMDVPEGWRSTDHTLPILTSTTQKAHSYFDRERTETVATFSFPLHFEFALEEPKASKEAAWMGPLMYFQVKSCDAWNRHCTEGYGYARLPTELGFTQLEIPLWKPVGDRISEMRAFFLGNGPELENLTFLDDAKKKKIVNKFGGQITPAGTLRLRFHVARVHKQEPKTKKHIVFGNKENRPGGDGQKVDVKEALERAKARIQAILKQQESNSSPLSDSDTNLQQSLRGKLDVVQE